MLKRFLSERITREWRFVIRPKIKYVKAPVIKVESVRDTIWNTRHRSSRGRKPITRRGDKVKRGKTVSAPALFPPAWPGSTPSAVSTRLRNAKWNEDLRVAFTFVLCRWKSVDARCLRERSGKSLWNSLPLFLSSSCYSLFSLSLPISHFLFFYILSHLFFLFL